MEITKRCREFEKKEHGLLGKGLFMEIQVGMNRNNIVL